MEDERQKKDVGCIALRPTSGKLILVANGGESQTGTHRLHNECLLFSSEMKYRILQCSARERVMKIAKILVPKGEWVATISLTSPPSNITDLFIDPVTRIDPTEVGLMVVEGTIFNELEGHFMVDSESDKPRLLSFHFTGTNQLDGCNRYVVSSEFVAGGN